MSDNYNDIDSGNSFMPSFREFLGYCISGLIKATVISLIISILCSGVYFFINYRSLNSALSEYDEAYEKYERELDIYNLEVQVNQNQLTYLEGSIAALNSYIETSDFMTLDNSTVNYAFVNLLIEPDYGIEVPDDLDTSDYAVVTLFNQLVKNPSDIDSLAIAGDVSADCVLDLIFTEVYPDNNLLSIRCYNADASKAEAMLDEIMSQTIDSYNAISDQIGTVSVTVVTQYIRENQIDYADELVNRQSWYRNRLIQKQSEYSTLYDSLSNLEAPVQPESVSVKSILKTTAIIGIIVFFISIFVYIFICNLGFYATNSCKSYSFVSSELNGTVIASKPFGKKKGKFTSKAVNSISGIYVYDFFTALRRALVLVDDSDKSESVFLCTSLINEQNYETVKEELNNISKEFGIRMRIVNDVVVDTQSMKALSQAKNVIYLSDFKNINYDSLMKTDSFFNDRGIKVSYIFV